MRTTAATGTIVAVILGALELIEDWTGWKSGITEEWILAVLAVVTPLIAWFAGSQMSSVATRFIAPAPPTAGENPPGESEHGADRHPPGASRQAQNRRRP
jgi:hypothetical protein